MKNTIKKKKGFTLIELLAVIVILAIIALIAVPVIMNIINKANKSAFKDTAYGIISAGELYFAERQLDLNGMQEDVTLTLPDTTNTLGLKGEVPEGSIIISKEGKVALAVQNGRYCITKGFDDTDVTVTENAEECKNPGEPSIMTSENACITSGTCTADEIKAGILVNVKVNETENYDFYVIADNGTELTLIMNQNLGGTVAWITEEDYATANTDGTSCIYSSCTDEGPLTALNTLNDRTSGWTNIEEREYTYSDDGGGNKYTAFTETMRARMLTYTEAKALGCTSSKYSCPSWLYGGTGYWTTSAVSSDTGFAWYVLISGRVYDSNFSVNITNISGLRPVITISKSL